MLLASDLEDCGRINPEVANFGEATANAGCEMDGVRRALILLSGNVIAGWEAEGGSGGNTDVAGLEDAWGGKGGGVEAVTGLPMFLLVFAC